MRYLRAAEDFEAREAELVSRKYGRLYAPTGPIALGESSALDAGEVELVEIDGEVLAIEPESASWSFLSPREADILRSLAGGRPLGWLESQWPAHAPMPARDFASILFRRGLLRIDGLAAVDRSIFEHSPNVEAGHLIELLLTENCNLACGYCLAGTGPHRPSMTGEVARRAIDLAMEMPEAKSLAFEFSGGEPLLRFPLMREIADYARAHPLRQDRNVCFTLQTNATLLDEENVRWLKTNDVTVGVSLDGDEKAQNRSRPTAGGGPSFRRMLNGIDLLQKHAVSFGALIVLNRWNADDLVGLMEFLIDNDITVFRLNPAAFLGTCRSSWDEYGLDDDTLVRSFQDFMQLLVRQRYRLLEDNLATMCTHLVSKCRRTRCLRAHCGAGVSFQCIAPNGDIFPCGRSTQTPDWRLGNVMDPGGSLSERGRANPLVKELMLRRPRGLDGCRICPYRQLCQSGCPAEAYEKFGTIRSASPFCVLYRAMYPHLMRWLSFDPEALAWLNQARYFNPGTASLAVHQVLGDERPA